MISPRYAVFFPTSILRLVGRKMESVIGSKYMKKDKYKRTRLSFNRKAVIASASVTKQKNAIHFFTEVDITEPRQRMQTYFEQQGEKLSFTAYIVACLAKTLDAYPEYNSFIRGRHIFQLENMTISVLIEREINGENVPEPYGIENANHRSYLELHNELRSAMVKKENALGSLSGHAWITLIPSFLLKLFIRIADKSIAMNARYGKIAVTAVGMHSREALWLIPHGSATVLASVGSFVNKVVEIDGNLCSREHLCLTVSFDHNIVDGAPAARFMNDFIHTLKSGSVLSDINS